MDRKKSHTDPRILRTRQLLKDAFVELLQEVDIDKISVNRLAERATINRVTFYLHYRDIPDMMEKMADDMIEDISIILKKTPVKQNLSESVDWERMVCFLEHIAENADFYKSILASKKIPIFLDRLLMLITDMIATRLDESKGSDSYVHSAGVQKDILIWYDSSALIGTIVAWLQNDMPYTPSYLAKQFSLLHRRERSKKNRP